ncbi:MAG: hypothetical protein JW889_05895 [Verrucomicrobia bacterium]|nr:hypothetical protein [Verrucomicrobiota bacterium]
MALTSGGTRAVVFLAFVVVAFFVVDLVLLQNLVKRERALSTERKPVQTAEPNDPGGTPGAGDVPEGDGTTDLEALRERIASLESEGEQLRATVAERFVDDEKVRSETAHLRVQLEEARAALETATADLAAVTQRETELRNERKRVADLVEKLNTDLSDTKAKRDQLTADLQNAQAATAAEKARAAGLQKSLDEAHVTLEAARELVEQKTKENAALQARIAELEGQSGSGANTGEE